MTESESRITPAGAPDALRSPATLMPARSRRPRALHEKRIAEPGELDQLKDALRLAAMPAGPLRITEEDRRISNED
jgi:hypothetical protein